MRKLTITLDLSLPAFQLSKLRAAITERVGREHELFHMHQNDPDQEGEFHRHYPLIQYKIHKGKVCITGVNAGSDALQYVLLPKLTPRWQINGKNYTVRQYRVDMEECNLALSEFTHTLPIHRWVGLNQNNYKTWKEAEGQPEVQMDILNRSLTGHLRSFAEGMGLPYFKAVSGKVKAIEGRKRVQWHGVNLLAFQVLAETNLVVPQGLGLGRLTAYGFGQVVSERYFQHMLPRKKQSSLVQK